MLTFVSPRLRRCSERAGRPGQSNRRRTHRTVDIVRLDVSLLFLLLEDTICPWIAYVHSYNN